MKSLKSVLSLFALSFGLVMVSAHAPLLAAASDEQPVLVAMVPVNGLPVEVSTSCDAGTAVFRVVNVGDVFPSAIVFNIIEVGTDKVISKRRLNLVAGQVATFKLKNADKMSGEVGLFMDAQWFPREPQIDASVQCG